MASNNTTGTNLETESNSTNIFAVGAFVLRFIAVFATIMNTCVLLLLVRLKRNFRNYSYWFQIVVLSSEDLLNGLSSFALTFFDLEIFRTSATACGILLWAYACSQINTLLGICCICVNRFRGILIIDKLQEPTFGYQQEMSILLAVLISIVYSLIPYLTIPLSSSKMLVCSTATLFGPNVKTYKLTLASGLIIPLAIINVLYSICLVELRRVNTRVKPLIGQWRSNYVTRIPTTQESQAGTSGEGDRSLSLKTNEPDSHENISKITDQKDLKDKIKCIEDIPKQSKDPCSTSTGTDSTGNATRTCDSTGNATKTCKNERSTATDRVRARMKEANSRAVKLLGIILFLTNITVIIPVSLLIRDTVAPQLQAGGNAVLGMLMLPLNSLVDAFVYGFFSVEIRTFIRSKVEIIWRLFRPHIDTTG